MRRLVPHLLLWLVLLGLVIIALIASQMNRQKPLANLPPMIASFTPASPVTQIVGDGAAIIATAMPSPTGGPTPLTPTGVVMAASPTLATATLASGPTATPTTFVAGAALATVTPTETAPAAATPTTTPLPPSPTMTASPSPTATLTTELTAAHVRLGPPDQVGVRLITGEVVNTSQRALAVAGLTITLTNGLGQTLATPVTKHVYWPLSSLAPGDRMPFEAGVLVDGDPVQVAVAISPVEAIEPAPRLDLEINALAQTLEGAFVCTQVQVRNPGPALAAYLRVAIVYYDAELRVAMFRDEVSGPPLSVSWDRPAEFRLCVPAAEAAGSTFALRAWGR